MTSFPANLSCQETEPRKKDTKRQLTYHTEKIKTVIKKMPRFKALYCKVFPQDEPVGIQIKKACPVELFLVDGLDSTMKTRTKSENSSEVKFKMTQEAKETGGTQRLLINNYVSENCFLKHKKEASDTHATDTTKPFDTQLERTNKKNKGGILRRLGKRLRKLGRNIVGKATKG